MNHLGYLTGAELEAIEHPTPESIFESLDGYVNDGGDILPSIYDRAIAESEPPMNPGELMAIIDLCRDAIGSRHEPATPVDHKKSGRQELGINSTQAHFAALLGATTVRLKHISKD